jgi:hypothetical protein
MSTCFTFFCFPLTFFPFQFFGHYRTYFFFFSLYSFPTCVAFRQSVVANTHDRTSIATLFRITGEVNFHLMRTVTMTTIYKKKTISFLLSRKSAAPRERFVYTSKERWIQRQQRSNSIGRCHTVLSVLSNQRRCSDGSPPTQF